MQNLSLFDSDTQSVNETAPRNLPNGEADYDITKAQLHTAQGKPEMYALFGFRAGANIYTHFLLLGTADGSPLDSKQQTRKRMSAEIMKGLWDASGLEGNAGIDRLPNFVGKRVRLNVVHSGKDDSGNPYINIRGVFKPGTPAAGSAYHQPEDPDDKIDMTPAPANTAPAETPAATPEPAASGTKKRWSPKK